MKKADRKLPTSRPLNRKLDSAEEAAQEKTDYAWNTVFKNVDWDKFEKMREKQ